MNKFLVLFFISFSLSAQIRGVVKDSISGEPIPYVNIWVENETIGTTSEADGSFFLEASKEKNIVFSVLGYEKKTIKGSEISLVNLKPTTYELNEIVVLNKKQSKKIEIDLSRIFRVIPFNSRMIYSHLIGHLMISKDFFKFPRLSYITSRTLNILTRNLFRTC